MKRDARAAQAIDRRKADNARLLLTQQVRLTYEKHRNRARAKAAFVKTIDGDSKLRLVGLGVAFDTLLGEVERHRSGGLRKGYIVRRDGKQLSLALLDHTFAEAWASVDRLARHAAGAAERAAFDRHLLDVAEERCRERGLDPAVTELTIREFIDADEATQMWEVWRAA